MTSPTSGSRGGGREVPKPSGALALSLMINSTGSATVRLKPLLTVDELDEAAKKTPAYRAPGQ